MDFCDFNLIHVASCCECGFSSNNKEHFNRTKSEKTEFSVEKFSKGWEEKIAPLLKKAQGAGEAFYSEDRDIKQCILSYDMAVATCEQMTSIATNDQQKGQPSEKKLQC